MNTTARNVVIAMATVIAAVILSWGPCATQCAELRRERAADRAACDAKCGSRASLERLETVRVCFCPDGRAYKWR